MGTYVVTGGESGMGAATTARLRAGGHRVVTVDIAETADIVADLREATGRRDAVEAVTRACDGALDGIATFAGIAARPWNSGTDIVGLNYFGTVEVLDGVRPLLAAAEAPAAVAVSSNSTTTFADIDHEIVEACLAHDEPRARAAAAANPHPYAPYPSSKTAIARWVRRTAVTPEWIGAGINLNAIAPGYVDTPMTQSGRRDELTGPLIDRFPLPVGRPGTPDELAGLTCFLLGPDARFCCGSVMFADGGTDAFLRADHWPTAMPPEVTW